jgi:hypothetical protein
MNSQHRPSEKRPLRRISEWLRWQRLLAASRYDPSHDPNITDASDTDFVIAGCPRSGTSLLAAQLFRPPDIVTCMEPWDGLRMPLASLMPSLRTEIRDGALSRGRLDIEALEQDREVRWIKDGEKAYHVNANPGFQLGVKWPAFWKYVALLETTRFLICVRDPVSSVTSFASSGGRLALGLDYDVAFNRAMNRELRSRTSDPRTRGAMLWEYINSRLLPSLGQQNVMVVRYEEWFEDFDGLLGRVGDFLGVTLEGSIVDLRHPRSGDPNSGILEAVAKHCPTSALLGYEV